MSDKDDPGAPAPGAHDTHAGAADAADPAAPSVIARLIASWIGLSMKMSGGSSSMKSVADAGMTIQQITAIHILMFEGACTVSQLTERLGLSPSATSHLVQRLVELGYVSRFEDEADRRSKLVSLTGEGRKLVQEMMKARLQELKESAQHLSDALRLDLRPVLERVVEELSWKAGEAWARRAQTPGHRAQQARDFRGRDMRGSDLDGKDLSGAVFTDLRLDGSSMDGGTFVGCQFDRARLDGCSMDGAVFTGASFVDARVDGSSCDGCNFDGADLTRARLDGCSLDGATFDNAVARGARFDGSSLDGARFDGADLAGARMDGCSLDGASFKDAVNIPPEVALHVDRDGRYRGD